MDRWEDGFVEVNGIKVHYYRTGGDKPQVVLNHGAMDDGLCWTRVVKELESDYDVIMVDARGHGLSDSGKGNYNSKTRATDLAETINMLGLDKPAIGGHLMGADTSFHLAAMYPKIPRGIFLEDPPPRHARPTLFWWRYWEARRRCLEVNRNDYGSIQDHAQIHRQTARKENDAGFPG